MHLRIKHSGAMPWYLLVIYGSPSLALHRFLWAELHSGLIHPSSTWLVFGDFNSVTSMHKVSSKNLDHRRCATFNAWIFDNKLMDMGFMGPMDTWFRGTNPDTFKGARLDRTLCNTAWHLLFLGSLVTNLPKSLPNSRPN